MLPKWFRDEKFPARLCVEDSTPDAPVPRGGTLGKGLGQWAFNFIHWMNSYWEVLLASGHCGRQSLVGRSGSLDKCQPCPPCLQSFPASLFGLQGCHEMVTLLCHTLPPLWRSASFLVQSSGASRPQTFEL